MKWINADLPENFECAYIIGLSDLHVGDQRFNKQKFLGYQQWILEHENAFVIVNGDICDNATKDSVGDTYESVLPPGKQIDVACELFRPLKDRILAWNEGNHEDRTRKSAGIYIGEQVCARLGLSDKYSCEGALVKIKLGKRAKGTSHSQRPLIYLIYATHGWSGARRIGGKTNAAEELQTVVAGVDVYLVSHTHQKFAFPKNILVPDVRLNKIEAKKQFFVSVGSFLEWGGYAERKGYSPMTMGAPRIRLDGRRHDVHVSI